MNLWYLDDANIADSPYIVLEDLQFLLRELNKIGLSINTSKCELTCLNLENPDPIIENFKQRLPNLNIASIDESVILGSPIATEGVRSDIRCKLDALKRMVSRLNLIDPHQAFVLLKNSFAIPKLTYLLRSSPAFKQGDLLHEFDTERYNEFYNKHQLYRRLMDPGQPTSSLRWPRNSQI